MAAADSIPEAIRLYRSGEPLARIGPRLGVSPELVRRWLTRAGVELRPRGYGANPGVRHDFFRTVDTDAKAWCLGFIGADGSVSPKLLRITLHSQDREILERMRALFAPGRPVVDFEHSGGRSNRVTIQSNLTVFSAEMVRDLARHGIHPRKSLTYEPWAGPPHLMPAYWRGMVDGDGSWWHRKNNPSRWGVSLCGTRAVCEAFAEFCRGVGASATITQRRTIWVAKCEGTVSCQKVARTLYAGQTISLARKRAKVAALLAVEVRKLRDWSAVRDDELRRLHGELGSWAAVAERLETTAANVNGLRYRRGMELTPHTPKPSTWAHVTAGALRSLRDRHGSWLAVAEELGTASGVVSSLRKRLGVTEKLCPKRRRR